MRMGILDRCLGYRCISSETYWSRCGSYSLGVLWSYALYGDWVCSPVASASGVCLRVFPDVALSCAAINALNRESGLLTSCAYVPDSVI